MAGLPIPALVPSSEPLPNDLVKIRAFAISKYTCYDCHISCEVCFFSCKMIQEVSYRNSRFIL